MSHRGHGHSSSSTNSTSSPHAHQRASSVPSSRSPCPPRPIPPLTIAHARTQEPDVKPDAGGPNNPVDGDNNEPDNNGKDKDKDKDNGRDKAQPAANSASLLQPRVAVALNVPRPWHPWLFALRLASILPAVLWGTPVALRLLLVLLDLVLGPPAIDGAAVTSVASGIRSVAVAYGEDGGGGSGRRGGGSGGEGLPLPVTEMALASIWCFACGYLSFFFTDCLMSRWLINYTPQATMVRLLTIAAVNAYVTSTVLSLAGGFQDLRLLLPGWIGIATTLTVCYHITHQKINIRKETSTSINVFSIASYITMVTLLIHMHLYKPGYPAMPLVAWGQSVWRRIQDSGLLAGTASGGEL